LIQRNGAGPSFHLRAPTTCYSPFVCHHRCGVPRKRQVLQARCTAHFRNARRRVGNITRWFAACGFPRCRLRIRILPAPRYRGIAPWTRTTACSFARYYWLGTALHRAFPTFSLFSAWCTQRGLVYRGFHFGWLALLLDLFLLLSPSVALPCRVFCAGRTSDQDAPPEPLLVCSPSHCPLFYICLCTS